MSISVLTEPTTDGRFRAASGSPFNLEVVATSRGAARSRLLELIQQRVREGAEIEELDVRPTVMLAADAPVEGQQWVKFAGSLPDDDLQREWLQAIEEYRAKRELEP